MSLSKSDVFGENDTIQESETEINMKIQEDQNAVTGNIIIKDEELVLNEILIKDLLEIEDDKNDLITLGTPAVNITNNEYDAFASDNKIYRKYKLRQRKNTEISQEPVPVPRPVSVKSSKTIKKPEEDYTCPYCFMNFANKNGYTIHVAVHEKKTPFLCSQCSAAFSSNAELISHKDTHKNENDVFFCKLCKLAFSEYCDFLMHKTTHRTKKQYKCPECDYITLKKYYIHIHIETHFNRKVQCHVCDKMISSSKFQIHLREHSSKFQCVECGKEIKSKCSYKYHMSSHIGLKRFQCLYCGKGFFNRGQRNVHTRIHTGEKRFECPVCFEKFRQLTDMKRHMVTHDTVKKHKCTICDKKFFHKYYLENVHMKMHADKLEYNCNFCKKAFFNKTGLKAHVLYVHTNEKPFTCKICNTSFVAKGQYNRHCRTQLHKNNLVILPKP